MKQVIATFLALVLTVGPVVTSFGYTKPNIYSHDSQTIVFKNQYIHSPHAWIIVKAIDLLRHDGYMKEADAAQKHLLPMLEGVTFNDVWGDADLAGGSVLDYYIPDNPDENYGYGHVLSFPLHAFAPYKNSTHSFATHPLYGYENAAEHAQFRYDYAVRIAKGRWGDDPRDLMAGWVNDTIFGQDDPQDGRYASGDGIDHPHHTWGNGQTAATAFLDMWKYHSMSQVVFPSETEDALSTIYVPKADILENHSSRWFDDYFGDADDIEAFNGYDNHGYAVYANWTRDASGHCNGGADCAAPMIVRLPVGSNAHAFFQLGWSLHLLEDVTTPVHTINGSLETYEVHNDIETRADEVLVSPYVSFNGQVVKDALPALTKPDFTNLYSIQPPTCADKAVDPAQLFAPRRYSDNLPMLPGEGVAHAYVRNLADISHTFIPYIECIDTESDNGWDSVGFFTASGFDTGIKGAAGLIHQFMSDSGMADTTPPVISFTSTPTSPTNQNVLSFTGSASDTGSTVKSVEYSLDDGQTWHAANPTNGTFSDSLTEGFTFTTLALPDGIYAIRTRATDVSNNITPPASQPRQVIVVDTTPPSISIAAPVAGGQYSHNATLTLNYSVTDNLSGVRNSSPTMDEKATLAGRGLASGQAINLLTEMPVGNHTFTIAAGDNANNNASKSVSFSIIVTDESIKGDVSQFLASGNIKNQGLTNSLMVKLNAAASARSSGKCQTAANSYQAFINELQAQRGKGVDISAAQIMIADAQYLIAHCP